MKASKFKYLKSLSLNFSMSMICLFSFSLGSTDANAATDQKGYSFPEIGKRTYSLPEDAGKEVADSSLTTIESIDAGSSGLKDPITDRQIKLKQIIGKSKYISEMQFDKSKPKVKSAFVTLVPMAIMGKSNEPSLRLEVERQKIGTSDAVAVPGLLKGIYKDAKKLK